MENGDTISFNLACLELEHILTPFFSAFICESHFKPSDINVSSSRKFLKLGSYPTENLPLPECVLVSPSGTIDEDAQASDQHQINAEAESTVSPEEYFQDLLTQTSAENKDKWTLYIVGKQLCAELVKERGVTSKFRLLMDQNLNITSISVHGWEILHLLKVSSLSKNLPDILGHFENMHVCSGIGPTFKPRATNIKTNTHHVLKWNKRRRLLESSNIYRSEKCTIILTNSEMGERCSECSRIKDFVQLSCSNEASDKLKLVFGRKESELNQWQRLFFEHQIQNAAVTPTQRRYHPDVTRWCIELYCRSPAAYRHMRVSDVLMLPCESTIRKYRNLIPPKSGINELATAEVERVMEEGHDNLPAFICVDEMKIKENLLVKDGKIEGFVDWTKEEVATNILAFYVRTVKREISLPIAWWPTRNTLGSEIALKFWRVVTHLEKRNVHVHAVIADECHLNRKFFKLVNFHTDEEGSFTAPNPFDDSRPIFLCSDPPHLLKTVRNSFAASKPTGNKYLNMDGGVENDILWGHVEELLKREQQLPLTSWRRLTNNHIQLTPFSKMSVKLAKDVLSWNVAQTLSLYVPRSQGTSNFILLFYKWFEIMSTNPGNPIRTYDDERLLWLENVFLPKIINWKDLAEKHNHPKRMLAKPTMEGLIFTTRNFVRLARRLLSHPQLAYIGFKSFTQDAIEAFFGNLRQLGRRSQAPDVSDVAYGFSHIVQRKVIKHIKGGNTTFGDKNAWTTVSDESF